jgi:hypothetical protein
MEFKFFTKCDYRLLFCDSSDNRNVFALAINLIQIIAILYKPELR